jgi:hypothetical protein
MNIKDENQIIAELVTKHHEPIEDKWASWEVQQALEAGDVERAAELAELALSDTVTWM